MLHVKHLVRLVLSDLASLTFGAAPDQKQARTVSARSDEYDWATHLSGFLNLGLPTHCSCSPIKRVGGVDQGPVAQPCRGLTDLGEEHVPLQRRHGSGNFVTDGKSCSLVFLATGLLAVNFSTTPPLRETMDSKCPEVVSPI